MLERALGFFPLANFYAYLIKNLWLADPVLNLGALS